jgi:AraC-like DNA-binding protein
MIKYEINSTKDIFYQYSMSETCKVDIHLHDFYEIYMALSNNLKYFIEGNVYELSRGDIIITNNLEVHRPQVTNSDPYERRYIQFKPQVFSHLLSSDYNPLRIFTGRTPGNGNKIGYPLYKDSPIMDYMDTISELHRVNDSKNQLLIYSYMIQLLVQLDKIYESNRQTLEIIKSIDKRVLRMLNSIEENYKTDIQLQALCDALFVDKYYMSHLFKDATGFTIFEYIQSKRVQYAKKLITEGMPITEVCYACGFQDYSNFYKTFKKLVNQSPKKYRANMQ